MTESPERSEEFEVEDGYLIHRVTPSHGRPYVHRCNLASYKELTWAAEELSESGFTVEGLVRYVRNQPLMEGERWQPRMAWTSAAVALAFWKDRGFIEKRFRKNYIDERCFYESAMIEFFAMGDAARGVRENQSNPPRNSDRGEYDAPVVKSRRVPHD